MSKSTEGEGGGHGTDIPSRGETVGVRNRARFGVVWGWVGVGVNAYLAHACLQCSTRVHGPELWGGAGDVDVIIRRLLLLYDEMAPGESFVVVLMFPSSLTLLSLGSSCALGLFSPGTILYDGPTREHVSRGERPHVRLG